MITSDAIVILNAAREILKRVERESMTAAWDASQDVRSDAARPADWGRVAEAASVAEGAIFNVLNVASNYARVEMTYAELHGRPEPEEAENV